MANRRIEVDVGLRVDKSSLTELKSSLQAIQQEAAKASGSDKMTKELKESAKAAQQLEKILDSAWNGKLQQFNLNKVNDGIKTTYGGVNQLKTALEKSGNVGATAYNKVASSLLTTNVQLKQSSKLLDTMATTMANTVKWGVASSVMNNFTSSIQKAWSYTKSLNTSLNDIRIITGESADKMDEFAKQANTAAKDLGKSTLDYTKASLIYYQQGLSDEEVAARAETTLKAANVTGQSGEAVSEQLTAVWNGYKVSAEEAELYIDKLAAVAATTAADLEELSTGMSKVASAANLMGVDIDSLNAQMATIVSVTRQAPESVGTALKTIYARMGDIEAGLDAETTLGSYTKEMQAMGVNVLDANGKLRDMGDVINEIGGNWKSMTREQQLSLSQTMAGTRQYNNLLSLFDNWDMYTKALNTSANAAGTLQEQQDTYMESTAAHLQQLRTETQRTYDLIFDTDTVNGMVDALSGGIEFFNNFIEGIDGGGNALLLFGSIAANVFDKQIAGSLLRIQNNLQVLKMQIKDTFNKTNTKEDWINTQAAAQVNMNNAVSGVNVGQAGLEAQQKAASEILKVQKGLTQEQYQQSLEINKQIGLETQRLAQLRQEEDISAEMEKGLALMNANKNMSDSSIEVRVNNKKEALAILEQEKKALIELKFLEAEVANNQKTGTEAVKEALMYEEQYKAILGTIKTEDAQIDASWERVLNSIKEGSFSVNQFKNIIDQIEREELEINAAIKAGNDLLRARSPQLQREKEEAQKRKQAYEDESSKIVAQGETNMKMQKFVNIGMAAVGVISSLTGAMSVLGDETAGTEQKVHAVGSAFSGVAMAVGSAFGPTGMVIGGIVGALGSLVSQLDFVEDAFKSTEERMEEFKAQQKELISDAEQFRSAKKSLSEIAEEYENLADKANADHYDSDIDELTEEERARYNELKGLIAEYNEEAVIAHNAEGEAILAKNAGIQETIDLLKEQYELEAGQKISENWAEQNETKEKELQEATEGQQKAQAKVDEYNSPRGKANLESTSKIMVEDAYNQIVSMTGYLEDEEGKIQQAFADLNTAYTDGQLTEADVDNYLDTIKEASDTNTSRLQKAAKCLRDGITYTQDEVDKANDELATANIELERTQHVDVSHILNAIKYVEGYNEGYDKLGDLEIETVDTDALITDFIESLEFGKDKDGETYEELTQKVSDYVDNLYEGLSQLENPDEIFSKAQEIEPANFNSVKEYNQGVLDKINEIINSNKEQFDAMGAEQKKALFEALFGVEGLEFNEENLADKVNTGYKEKRENLIPDMQKDLEDGGITHLEPINESDLVGLSPEHIDNFSQVKEHINLATVETEGWKAALDEAAGVYDKIKNAQIDINKINEDAEAYGLDSEELEDHAKRLQEIAKENDEVADSLEENGEAAEETAVAHKRLNKGLDTLQENFEDQKKILKKGSKESEEYTEAMEGIKDALGDVLNIDGGNLTDGFVEENLKDIEAAANGDVEAIERLRNAAAQDILCQVMGVSDFSELSTDMQNLHNEISNFAANNKLEIGATVDNTNFIASCNKMISDAGMTATEVSNYFKAMGYDANLKTVTKTIPGKTETYTETGEAFAGVDPDGNAKMVPISTKVTKKWPSQKVKVPVVETLTYTGSAGGSVNFSNTSAGGASTGGSGGGGGGGGKSKKTTTKKQEKTADRYHDINNQIDKLATKFDRLAEAQDRLHGKELYNNLNKQLKVINQQIKASKEKLKIAKEEKKELQDKLKKEGFKFDIDGDISNYETRLEQLRKTINDKVSKYNKMSAKNQNKKAGKKLAEQIEKLKEEYAEIEDWIKQYDDLLVNTIPELEDEVTQLARTKVEIQVEKLKIKADLTLDISEALRQWEDFKREIFQSDNPLDEITSDMTTMDSIMASNSIRENAKGLNNATQALDDIQNGRWTKYSDAYILKDENGNPIRDENGKYKFDEQAARDTIDYFQDAVQGEMETFYDAVRGAYDAYLTSVENAIEATHDYHDALNDVQDVLDHTMNMITMLKGEYAFEDIESILNQKINATKAEIKAIKAAIDESQKYTTETVVNADGVSEVVNVSRTQYLEKMQAQYEEEIASLENQIATEKDDTKKAELEVELNNLKIIAETNQKELDMEREYMQELQANLRENVEEYTELLIQRYQNAVSKALKGFNTYLTGALGTEGMSREWENAIAQEDRYLDKINAAYELRSLENKINESINDTDSLSAQKQLNEFKEKELKLLREKDKLTKYDVDRANKLYEIELKKIALEEARNNKSQMRLRRDSSGNYSYQFVADDESLSKAQQELDASMNDLYNMEKEEYRNRTEELNQVREDFNDFNQWWSEQSEEYRKNNQAWYDEQVKSYEEQMKDISDLALTARNQTLATANDLMGEDFNETVMEEMLPTWKTAMATMVDQVQNETGFQAAMTNAINVISEASAELTSSLNTLNEIIGGTKEGSLADTTNKYYTDATQGANDYAKAQQAVVEQTKAEKEAVAELREELDALLVTRGKFGNVGGGAQDGSGGTNDNGYNKELGLGWGAIGDSTEEETENDVEDAQGINSGVPNTRQVATLTDGRKVGIAAAYLYRKNSEGKRSYGGWSQKKMVEIFGDAQKKTLWTFIQNAKSKDAKAKAAQNDKNPKTKPVWSKAHKFYNNSKNNKALAYTYSKAKDWKKNKKVEFRTGGYTGNWSSDEGKLAVLHKKELVLNAKDTENLLSIINIVRDLTKNAMSGKPTKEQKEMSIKSEALFESLAEIRKELLTMNETDQFLAEKELSKEESMLSLLDNLAVLEEGFREFKGTEFLEALDYLNVFKDTLNTQLNNQNYQSELALSSTEYQAKLFEELNQTLTATILDSVQSHLEKLNTDISHQAQVLTQIADDNKKSFANDKTDIQQEVKVYADFPNATSANEIQKALENLVNAATQHAYTTRR